MKSVSRLLELKVLGAIKGALVGDAIGVPYEFEAPRKPEEVVLRGFGTHNQPPGTWSDDGALLLCAVASLAEKGEFCPNHLCEKFLLWQAKGYMACRNKLFDIGTGTVKALYRMRQGVPPLEAGSRLFENCGNGSLMRILPHGLFHKPKDLEERVSQIHDSSSITHSHPLCQVTCALYCLMVNEILEGTSKRQAYMASFDALSKMYQKHPIRSEHLRALNEEIHHKAKLGSGFVLDTFQSALQAFFQTENYKEAIQMAVSFGGDTDTVASLTGGLAGAFYGVEAIPKQWLDSLQMEEEARLAIELFTKKVCDLK